MALPTSNTHGYFTDMLEEVEEFFDNDERVIVSYPIDYKAYHCLERNHEVWYIVITSREFNIMYPSIHRVIKGVPHCCQRAFSSLHAATSHQYYLTDKYARMEALGQNVIQELDRDYDANLGIMKAYLQRCEHFKRLAFRRREYKKRTSVLLAKMAMAEAGAFLPDELCRLVKSFL